MGEMGDRDALLEVGCERRVVSIHVMVPVVVSPVAGVTVVDVLSTNAVLWI